MFGVLKCQNVAIHQTLEFIMKGINLERKQEKENIKLALEKFKRLHD